MGDYPYINAISNSKVATSDSMWARRSKTTVWCVQTSLSHTYTSKGRKVNIIHQTGHILLGNGKWQAVKRHILTYSNEWASPLANWVYDN